MLLPGNIRNTQKPFCWSLVTNDGQWLLLVNPNTKQNTQASAGGTIVCENVSSDLKRLCSACRVSLLLAETLLPPPHSIHLLMSVKKCTLSLPTSYTPMCISWHYHSANFTKLSCLLCYKNCSSLGLLVSNLFLWITPPLGPPPPPSLPPPPPSLR